MLYNRIMELRQWHLERGSQGPVDLGFEPTEAERRPYAIHQSGKWYTNENIDQMLMERHLNKKARRASGKNHLKGPRKRTSEDDEHFRESFEKMIHMAMDREKYPDAKQKYRFEVVLVDFWPR